MARRKKPARRRFGKVRLLPSGRYQASYLGADGLRRAAPHTFEAEDQAEDWLTLREAELLRGDWTDPDRGKIPLSVYGRDWIDERPELRPRTAEPVPLLFGKYIERQLALPRPDTHALTSDRAQPVSARPLATNLATSDLCSDGCSGVPIADLVPDRFRTMILVTTFASPLRRGHGSRRRDVDALGA